MPLTSELNFTPSVDRRGVAGVDRAVGAAKSKIVSCGVTAVDGAEAGLAALAFIAVTVNV